MRRTAERVNPLNIARFVFYRVLIRAVHAGRRYECPCCGGTFRSFRSFGSQRNIRCPACGSLERQRALWLYLRDRENLTLPIPRVLLHVAPELCLRRLFVGLSHLQYVCGDLEPEEGSIRLDIRDLPFPDKTFDYVVCSHVLEHVLEDRLAMSELGRVLKRDGQAILQVPVDDARAHTYEDPSIVTPQERERVFGQDDHVRIYGRDFVERLRESGFDVEPVEYARGLLTETRDRYRLDESEKLYVCRPTRV